MGHRNPQGLVWDPKEDVILSSEHGPIGGDEVNIIKDEWNISEDTSINYIAKFIKN